MIANLEIRQHLILTNHILFVIFYVMQERDSELKGGTWLLQQIEKKQADEQHYRSSSDNSIQNLKLPKKIDGKSYKLSDLSGDQEDIACYVLQNIKQWLEQKQKFTPLRLTVTGEAGTGKSVLINTLVTSFEQFFKTMMLFLLQVQQELLHSMFKDKPCIVSLKSMFIIQAMNCQILQRKD